MARFHGRDSELTLLAQELQQVADAADQDRPGRCLLIRGRRRVGKSRLVETFIDRAEVPSLYFTAAGDSPAGELERLAQDAILSSLPGRELLERDDLIIGLQFSLRAGRKMSSWLTGFDPDPQWSRLGTGIATLLEAFDAGARAGCEIVDLGVGDEAYKETFRDGTAPLESVTWCRPRLARLLQLETNAGSG